MEPIAQVQTARCKFRCVSVKQTEYDQQVELSALYSESKEDNSFASATPSGNMTMSVTNRNLWGYFVPGKAYYLDIHPADAKPETA